jgi:uncharacterized protein YjbI with pentapeptide repeats
MDAGLPEKVLQSLDETRRSFLSKLIVGSAFAVPSVASFSMSGLGIDDAFAQYTTNMSCSNFSILCSNQCSLIGKVTGNFSCCNYPGANLHGLDLSGDTFIATNFAGANLSYSILSGDDLTEANLSGANLNGAMLNGATLNCAVLTGANLNNANLIGAVLTGATLVGANLHGANLMNADLSGADLQGANLHGAILTGVTWFDTKCPDGTNSSTNGTNSCAVNL